MSKKIHHDLQPIPDYIRSFVSLSGTFVSRPNRFVSWVHILNSNGETMLVSAHVADPGRLRELLLPGAPVLLRDHGESLHRKHRYTLEMVQNDSGLWVSLNTQLPNKMAAYWLSQGVLPGFEGYSLIRTEVTVDACRLDFQLVSPSGQPVFMEVKSCTLVEDGRGLFPDAPSARAGRHVQTLIHSAAGGNECWVVFMIQRPDAWSLSPNRKTDPALATLLQNAILKQVGIKAYVIDVAPDRCRLVREVPVIVDYETL